MLELREQHPTAGSARDHGYAVIGSACERTIARHLLWVEDNIAAMLLEVNEWVAELAPFTALPPVRVSENALAQLRRSVAALEKARQAALGITVAFTVIGCVHLACVAERARSPPAISLNRVIVGGCVWETEEPDWEDLEAELRPDEDEEAESALLAEDRDGETRVELDRQHWGVDLENVEEDAEIE